METNVKTISVLRWEEIDDPNDDNYTIKDRFVESLPLGDTVTEQVQRVFGCGQCHALSAALHELTGWDILGLSWPGYRYIQHFAVQVPDKIGVFLDVHGTSCPDYGTKRIVTYANALKRRPDWIKPNMEAARHFAPIVLRDQDKLREARFGELIAARDKWKPL